jgi:hypothetical protein
MQPWQLEKVLSAQRAGDARLFGEIAIELGYIEDAALKLYVDSHRRDPLARIVTHNQQTQHERCI